MKTREDASDLREANLSAEGEKQRVAGENLLPTIRAEVEAEFAPIKEGLANREKAVGGRETNVKEREYKAQTREQKLIEKLKEFADAKALTNLVKVLYYALERVCAGYMIDGKGQFAGVDKIKDWLVPLLEPVAKAAEKARAESGGGPIPPFPAGEMIEIAVRKEREREKEQTISGR